MMGHFSNEILARAYIYYIFYYFKYLSGAEVPFFGAFEG